MSYSVVVRPQVHDDLREAEAWYEEREPGLGTRFLQAARQTILLIRRNPLIYCLRHAKKQIRWAYLKRFPYRVVYRVSGNTIVIYAVLHGARHDRSWKERI